MLEACDIQIGELQSKMSKTTSQPERTKHEKELNTLKAKRARKALQKQKSIEEKKLIEVELDGLRKLGKPKVIEENIDEVSSVEALEDSDKKARDPDMLSSARSTSDDDVDDNEPVFNAVYYKKKAEEVIKQLK